MDNLHIEGRMFRVLLALEADGAPQVGHHRPEMLMQARTRLRMDPMEAQRDLQIKLYISAEDIRRALLDYFKSAGDVPEEFKLLIRGGWVDPNGEA